MNQPANPTTADLLTVQLANGKLIEGKRHLLCGDYVTATDCFEEGLQILVAAHGELHPNCAQAYYLYGCGLLNQCKSDGDVFNNANEVLPQEEEEEEEEEEEGKKEAATRDNTNEEEEEEEVSNLQVAWEVMECARLIYTQVAYPSEQQGGDGCYSDVAMSCNEAKGGLAKVHMRLGEHGLENGNYEQAIEDFKEALRIHREYLPVFHRVLAECHYELALAMHYAHRNDEAIEQFEAAAGVIRKKMALFDADKSGADNTASNANGEAEKEEKKVAVDVKGKGKQTVSSEVGDGSAAVVVTQEEYEEMKSILPEIDSKIEECRADKIKQEEMKQKMSAASLAAAGEGSSSSGAADGASSSSASGKLFTAEEEASLRSVATNKDPFANPEFEKVKTSLSSSSTAGGSAAPAVANTLTVKRKPKRVAPTLVSESEPATCGGGSSLAGSCSGNNSGASLLGSSEGSSSANVVNDLTAQVKKKPKLA
eukprot:Nk52_evm1s1647 gene=Nk52_evmTU1s1647